jgi:hypothetical protein
MKSSNEVTPRTLELIDLNMVTMGWAFSLERRAAMAGPDK